MPDPGVRGAPTVLVVSTHFRAGPWAYRSLKAAGYRVRGAHRSGFMAGGRSLACPRPLRYPSPTDDHDGFIAAVRAICDRERVDVVLPGAEDTARLLAEHEPDLAGAVVAGPGRAAYAALCDKGRLADAAGRAGIDHPRTVVVGLDGPAGGWPPLPSVVKPRISGEDLQGAAAAISVRTAGERDRAVAALASAGLEAVVQERVEGTRWVGHCVRDGEGRLDLVASRIEHDYPRLAGTASVQRTVLEAPEPLERGVRGLLDSVGYVGPATVSFFAVDGRMVVHDVNLRLGASLGIVIRSGLDMPRRAVEAALGLPPSPDGARREIRYARLDGEAMAALDALRGRARGEGARRVLARLVEAAFARDGMVDPSPLDPFLWATVVGRRALDPVRRLVRPLRHAVGTRA
jgi:predicted ATP-grasp superfamily ATP-dependent carboligase